MIVTTLLLFVGMGLMLWWGEPLGPMESGDHGGYRERTPAPPTNAWAPADLSLDDPVTWAHMLPHGLPMQQQLGESAYGATYPLGLRPSNMPFDGTSAEIERMRDAGVDGVQIMQFEGVNKGGDFVSEWLPKADSNVSPADGRRFVVAPCMRATTIEGAVTMIRQYVVAAEGHVSAARVRGRLLVFIYATRTMSPDDWIQVKTRLATAGLSIYLMGDVDAAISQNANRLKRSIVAPYFPAFDGSWIFDDSTLRAWTDILTISAHRDFAIGIMPGYDRRTPNGGYVDPEATKHYRAQWQASLESGLKWVILNTWNDVVERTHVRASSDWSFTRQDITAFYSRKLRGLAPSGGAELYISTPAEVRKGEAVRAEALVLNNSARPVQVGGEFLDQDGTVIGRLAVVTVAPGDSGAAAGLSAEAVDSPGLQFIRLHAYSAYDNGDKIQEGISAPMVIRPPGPAGRVSYYSIAARKALPEAFAPTVTIHRVGGQDVVRASSTLGREAAAIELIQNSQKSTLALKRPTVTAPTRSSPTEIAGGEIVPGQKSGYVVARFIDNADRVAYSDPMRIP